MKQDDAPTLIGQLARPTGRILVDKVGETLARLDADACPGGLDSSGIGPPGARPGIRIELQASVRRIDETGTAGTRRAILQRALPGLRDLLAVRWMRDRRRPTTSVEVSPDATGPSA